MWQPTLWQLLKEAEIDYLRTGSQEKFVELYKSDEAPGKELRVEYFKLFRETLIQGSHFCLVLLRAVIRNLPALLDMIDIDFSVYPVNLMYVRVWNVLTKTISFSRGEDREAVKAALCLRTLLSRNSLELKANLLVITAPDFYQWNFIPSGEWVEEAVMWSMGAVYQEVVRWSTSEDLGSFLRKIWSVTTRFPKARDIAWRLSQGVRFSEETVEQLPPLATNNPKELLQRLTELPLTVVNLLRKRYFFS